MAARSGDSRWLLVIGGTVFSPLGKVYRKVCVFIADEDIIDESLRNGLRQIHGSDALAETCGAESSSTEQLPWWAVGAPLHNLDDATALGCLERHLQKGRNLLCTNTNKNEILVYETDPAVKFENQQNPLSKESFNKYLEAWSEIIFCLRDGIETEHVDLSTRLVGKERTSAAASTRQEVPSLSQPTPTLGLVGLAAGAAGSGGPCTKHMPFGEQLAAQNAEKDASVEKSGEVIVSLLPTEILEINDDCEEEIQGPTAQLNPNDDENGAFNREHPRRSHRILELDSIPKKKKPEQPPIEVKKRMKKRRPLPPAAGIDTTIINDNEAGPSRPALDERQSRMYKTRDMPKKPVAVTCGDAEGLWDPKKPFVITVTKIGAGDGSPQAIAAAAELEKEKKRKGSLVVPCNRFEKIGGRGTSKQWKGKYT
jgi:hypothetical protein